MGTRSVLQYEATVICFTDICPCSVIQEIEEEDRLWQSKARQRQQKQMSKTPDPKQEKNDSASGVSPGSKVTQPLSGHTQETTTATTRKVPRAFY